MNILAEEVKRWIASCQHDGLTIETLPPPAVCYETMKRRIAARERMAKLRAQEKLSRTPPAPMATTQRIQCAEPTSSVGGGGNHIINVGGIQVEATKTPCGEVASRRTRYRATPYKGSKYVVFPKPTP